ncbi:hypothetical protein CFP56_017700 [Quercus suber]|uniref:Uncharacterized protein n=1 Tax=Quercus suber TaxID=58331 RepID=A0AAW0M0K7_QUESU
MGTEIPYPSKTSKLGAWPRNSSSSAGSSTIGSVFTTHFKKRVVVHVRHHAVHVDDVLRHDHEGDVLATTMSMWVMSSAMSMMSMWLMSSTTMTMPSSSMRTMTMTAVMPTAAMTMPSSSAMSMSMSYAMTKSMSMSSMMSLTVGWSMMMISVVRHFLMYCSNQSSENWN